MKNRLLYSFAAASFLLLGACSTGKLAQQKDQNDDVYYSRAQAKEEEIRVKQERKSDYVTEDELYGDDKYGDNYYDRDYSARIYRFRNYSPWRSYNDSWYGYQFDPFYSNGFYSYNNYYRPGLTISIGSPYGYYSDPWSYYGSSYYGSYWGPYSYYNPYNPYYGSGYYGGGYYGGRYSTGPIYTSPNYRPRPGRGYENIGNTTGVNSAGQGAIQIDGQGRVLDTRSRTERYDNGNQNRSTGGTRQSGTATQTATPQRQERSSERPTRTEQYTPPPTQERSSPSSPPPSNNSGRSSDNSSPRPTRGGGN